MKQANLNFNRKLHRKKKITEIIKCHFHPQVRKIVKKMFSTH